ncbi:hypothetical protein KUTeg_023012 [Tegillarca granosa]|uniref:Nuclear pore complex protein Nup160 n=1 Tax=Tegillarca granosa TaxID=220873 RepID=A0ABQ9E502_TEGGR|nr:hypothetical protein KUTeg_023012 [Tegillarca granosa]
MAESMNGKSFREVVVPAICNTRWREITVNAGASASTLQDIKVADSCGGYAYFDSGISQTPVRNRFIYWRTNSDVLELIEQSLDLNLIDCHVRYRFHDTPILGGISVHETHGNVDIGFTPDQSMHSIFFHASLVSATDPTNLHTLNPGSSITSQLHSAASYLTNEGEALFTFSSNMGVVQQHELSQSTMIQKLWTGLVPSSIRGGQEATDSATSLIIYPFRGEAFIFAVCRDHKLRIWSTKTRECVSIFNMLDCCPDAQHLQNQPITGSGHTISRVMNSDPANLKFCVFLNFNDRKQEDLVDYCITEDYLWTLWTNKSGESVARVHSAYGGMKGDNWMDVILQPSEVTELLVSPHRDPREIKTLATANEIDEEEYFQLQLDQWTKFYSCCVQYQEGNVTYVRPCDKIEDLYLRGQWADPIDHSDEWAIRRDLGTLGMCLNLIEKRITDDIVTQFEYQLLMNEDVEILVDGTVQTDTLGAMIQTIHDLPEAIRILLQINATQQLSCSNLFNSSVATEILAASLQQLSQTRLSALRDLLILQMSAIRLSDKDGMTPEVSEVIKRDLIPFTSRLIRAYVVLKWATTRVAINNQVNSLDFNMRQLAALEITENTGLSNQLRTGALQNITIVELFIRGVGGAQARTSLANEKMLEEEPCATWSVAILALVKSIAKLIRWPLSEGFVFPEFLVSSCQYLPLQEYVHLLCTWCEWNAASRKFMLGLSYLYFDESQKAAQCFIEASEGVSNDPYLNQKVLQTDEVQVRKLEVLYYLKVLKQFEEFSVPDVVVSLAKTAIGIADGDDMNVPTLWSKVFKYQLELGHNREAFNAMMANPDPSRKKDCLRQLLVTLCERGDLKSVVEFPYQDMENEVVSILESRARSVDLATHKYYDLLYAFHISKSNFSKAGSAMYEQGFRLGREVPGRLGLQRQVQCYLATMNCLRLATQEFAWIVKPVQSKSKNILEGYANQPAKHFLNGEEKSEMVPKKVEILELSDIEKEYTLVDARLRLIRKDTTSPISSGPTPGPDEMVGLLVNVGMYDRAVIVCTVFNLKFNSIFESLALSASDIAWDLLQQYLDRYDDHSRQYHRCTAIKLLSHGFPLPTWLVNSYKARNMSGLLRIYIGFDLLEEAVLLIIEYIDARLDSFLGNDSEVFGIKGCLRPNCQSSWLPYTCIDQLMSALKDHTDDITYGKMYENLQNKVIVYLNKVLTIILYIQIEDSTYKVLIPAPVIRHFNNIINILCRILTYTVKYIFLPLRISEYILSITWFIVYYIYFVTSYESIIKQDNNP